MLHHQIEAEAVLNTFMLHIKYIASRPLRAGEVAPLNLPPPPRTSLQQYTSRALSLNTFLSRLCRLDHYDRYVPSIVSSCSPSVLIDG